MDNNEKEVDGSWIFDKMTRDELAVYAKTQDKLLKTQRELLENTREQVEIFSFSQMKLVSNYEDKISLVAKYSKLIAELNCLNSEANDEYMDEYMSEPEESNEENTDETNKDNL